MSTFPKVTLPYGVCCLEHAFLAGGLITSTGAALHSLEAQRASFSFFTSLCPTQNLPLCGNVGIDSTWCIINLYCKTIMSLFWPAFDAPLKSMQRPALQAAAANLRQPAAKRPASCGYPRLGSVDILDRDLLNDNDPGIHRGGTPYRMYMAPHPPPPGHI